ncbi:hypothetical protein KAR91_76390 [Candidatus Pacearchaeota archaeon]|nr:hypothetical protein [Candidatus Pacearchaeota archaeon]
MARTIAEIQAAMVTAKQSETDLAGLTSTSQTAVWNLIFYECAVGIKVIEDLFVVQSQDIEDRRVEIPVGVLKWYASESLLFQYGDSLVFASGSVGYTTIDTTKYVVDLSAADVVNGIVVIKVANVTSGVAAPLTAPQITAFETYWTEKRFAGTSISIISVDPDLLKAEYTITYNPQILDSAGESLSAPGTFPVEDAIDTFLQTFQTTNFAGEMQVMNLTDAIQAAAGVLNAVATNVEGKPTAGSYIDILATTQQTYTATAGYMLIDPSFPLSGTLTYIPG